MPSAYDTLFRWACKTTSTLFGELLPGLEPEDEGEPDGLAYQLKHWPDLPCASRTAPVLRTLSVMSHRQVNRRWILASSGMKPGEVDGLLQYLVDQDAVTVTDLSRFGPAAERVTA